MDSFLQQTARSILASMDWKQLSRTTLVLPSHRAGLVLKDELLRLQQEQQAQAVWAPHVTTLPQLQDALSPLYPEDELFTIVRLYKLYIASNPLTPNPLIPNMSLDMFYAWGRQMVADFTNIDASMPAEQVANFFDNTIAAHELSQWQLDPETEQRLRALIHPGEAPQAHDESVKQQYDALWHQLYELYQALHAQMAAEQKGYTGMRQRAVIEQWNSDYVQSQIAGRTFIFIGFNYLLPVERELMERLRDAHQAQFYWDYVENFQTNEKAFSFTRLNSAILGAANTSTIKHQPSNITTMSCSSREAQAQYVHRWLQENYTAHGQRVGIVICDEAMLESVIYTLPAITLPGENEPEPINITKGFPLRNTQAYADTMAWLCDRARGDADTLVTPATIDELLDTLFPITEEEPLTPNPLTTNPLTWQELLILESEYQVRTILNKLRKILVDGIDGVPFTLRLLRLLVRRMMEAVTMPFHGEPVTDIQVMGVLETRMLDFDRLLLLNVEEGIVPQRQHDVSFIPFYLRKAYHMQTSDERATVYAYNFFRLLSRTEHATLLFASAQAAEGGKGMSRFIMQMLVSPEFDVTKRCLDESAVLSPLPFREGLGDGALSYWETKHPRSLSASALNTFIACPRQFYLHYVLGLQPKEEQDVLFAANIFGSLVHGTIEHLYRTHFHCDNIHPVRVTPEAIEALRTDETAIREALRAAYEKIPLPWEDRLENIVILGYVNNILERDREDAKVGLQLYKLEADSHFSLPIEGVGTMQFGGIIDRLDIYGPEGNEHLRVVDYKTGGYSDGTRAKRMTANWEELMTDPDKGYIRQTLLYCAAVASEDKTGLPIEPHLFFCRPKLTTLDTTVALETEPVNDYRSLQPRFLEALQPTVKHLLTATSFPPCEEKDCPSYCPFADLCARSVSE